MPIRVDKARISDVPQMHRLINYFANKGEMLARPISELYENVRGFFVVREGDKVLGCIALGVMWEDLAEIKSLAVLEEYQGQGIGETLVKACLKDAQKLDITTVFCLTYKPTFFEKQGFSLINKDTLPRKVWGECYRCPKYPDCDEIALIYHLRPAKS
ncbi:MAG: N-acetyltransferase [Chloroflexota bacterium]